MLRYTALLLTVTAFLSVHSDAFAGRVMFDTSHRVIFSPESEEKLGLKNFLQMFRHKGHAVKTGNAVLSHEGLKDTDCLVLPGPMRPYSKKEIEAMESFVRDGGSLVVLIHIAPPLARLSERFGIIVSNAVIAESENRIGGKPQDFIVKRFASHPLGRGLSGASFYGSWALLPEGESVSIADTSPSSWADLNRNRKRDPDEPAMSFSVYAAAEAGKGRIAVIADDAPLANAFIGEADNGKMAENLIDWVMK